MTPTHSTRPARAVRIYCPVEASTLQSLVAGRMDAIESDPALRAILSVIRADNPLGDFGLYRGVVEIGLGFESFVPTAEAAPTKGNAGAVAVSPTVILTTYIQPDAPDDLVSAALSDIAAAHSWETPVIEVYLTELVTRT